MESRKHKLLKQVGLRWIQSTGCVAFACEVRWGFCGIVDACGVKANGDVYIVEAKASTADLRSDVNGRKIYRIQQSRDVDFVYYIVANHVDFSILPTWVGILNQHGIVRRKAQRRKQANTITKAAAFEKLARALSWRAYGHVIRHEQEQLEFSILSADS